jgi:hypothetical protein
MTFAQPDRCVELGECLMFDDFPLLVFLTWFLSQALLERSRAKLEFLHREQGF